MSVIFETSGHHEWAAMCDVARSFFGTVEKQEEGRYASPSSFTLRVSSQVTPNVSAKEAREASRAGRSDRMIEVVTTIESLEDKARHVLKEVRETVRLHEMRRVLKRQLYIVLSAATGIDFPWGTLTGVRPTQMALRAVEQKGTDGAVGELVDYWRLSEEKAALAVETALAEEATLARLLEDELMLYVGLPFCPSRCLYCSFITQDATRQKTALSPYVDAVIREAQGVFHDGILGKVRSVYYGGGTPTSLPAPLFKCYLEGVLTRVPFSEEVEMTMEAGRPDTIDREKLAIAKACGFQKLSINPQTMHDETLKRIGRHHSVEETVGAFQLARAMGFSDINMDLIAGLPGEDATKFLDSVEQVIRLGPENITLHTLAVKRGSFLDRMFEDRDSLLPDAPLIAALEEAQERLRRHGYRPYYLYRQKNCRSGLENTGFTRDKKGSLYNVAMMSDRVPVIGLGSGASSKAIHEQTARRVHNPKDIKLYVERVDEQIEKKIRLFSTDKS